MQSSWKSAVPKRVIPFEDLFSGNYFTGAVTSIVVNGAERLYEFSLGPMFYQFLKYGSNVNGAYFIRNRVSGKIYVGSTESITARLNAHRFMLRTNTHRNKALQSLFKMANLSIFDFCVFVTDNREEAYDIEQALLDRFHGTAVCFNVAKDARKASLGISMSEDVRTKLLSANVGRKHSPEHIRKRVESIRLHAPHVFADTENKRLALAKYNRDKVVTDETKEKLRQANLGKKHSEETRKKMSVTRRNNPLSGEGLERALKAQRKRVSIEGVIYDSMDDAATALKVSRKTIYNRLHNRYGTHDNYFYLEEN